MVVRSVPRLQRLVLDVIAESFERISGIENRLPPAIGREVAKVQMRRGNVTVKVLALAERCRLNELSVEGVTLSEPIVDKLHSISDSVDSARFRKIKLPKADLISLLQSFLRLRFFDFCECEEFDDDVAAVVIRSNPNMERFFVSRANISDVTLDLLSECRCLKSIDLSYNRRVTTNGVLKLCQGESRQLIEDLRITCPDLGPAVLRTIHISCPNLRNFQSINIFYDDLARTPQAYRRSRRPLGARNTRTESFPSDLFLSDFGSNHRNTQYFIEF